MDQRPCVLGETQHTDQSDEGGEIRTRHMLKYLHKRPCVLGETLNTLTDQPEEGGEIRTAQDGKKKKNGGDHPKSFFFLFVLIVR